MDKQDISNDRQKNTAVHQLQKALSDQFTIQILLIVLLTLLTRSTQLGRPLGIDELFIFLAAENYVNNGTLSILDGVYERAPLFTKMIGEVFQIFDRPTPEIARLPSVIFGVLLSVSVFYWTKKFLGGPIAWIAVLLVIFWPTGIYLSQTVRYYSLQALVFFNASMITYMAVQVKRSPATKTLCIILAAILFLITAYLQVISLAGVMFVLLWCAGIIVLRNKDFFLNVPLWVYLALLVLSLGATALLFSAGYIDYAYKNYTFSPPWTQWRSDLYYLAHLLENYPTFTPALLFFILFSLAKSPQLMSLSVMVSIGTLLIMSLAGSKDLRYIYFSMPFLFLIFATGAWTLGKLIYSKFSQFHRENSKHFHLLRSWSAPLAVFSFATIFMIALNPVLKESLSWIVQDKAADRSEFWAEAKSFIREHESEDALIISDSDMETIYQLGDLDVHYSKSALFLLSWISEADEKEFEIDFRTGRPTISTMTSVERLLSCGYPVILIGYRDFFNEGNQIGERLSEFRSDPRILVIGGEIDSGIIALLRNKQQQRNQASCDELFAS